MALYVCHTECFAFNYHWHPGDLAESDRLPNKHFILLDGLEGAFEVTGRKFLIEDGRITGVWDG